MKRLLLNMKEADIRNILAILIVLASFALQTIIILKPIPRENHDIAITTVVLTLGLQGMVGGYFFGASKGERKIPPPVADSEKPIL
jgi:hypothetical protein